MPLVRWCIASILGLGVAMLLYATYNTYAAYTFQSAMEQELQSKLYRLSAVQRSLEFTVRRVKAIEKLQSEAERLGLHPEHWMVTRLELSSESDLQERVLHDAAIAELEKEKSEKLKALQGAVPDNSRVSIPGTPAVALAELEQVAKQYDQRIAQRREFIEQECRYTAERLLDLIHLLSNTDPVFSRTHAGQVGYWFMPESLTVQRRGEDLFTVDARGQFLVPR